MANSLTLVNEVTKMETGTGYIYLFPIGVTLEVYPATNTIHYLGTQTGHEFHHATNWSDITGKKGSTDAESYVDALANGRYFFPPEIDN